MARTITSRQATRENRVTIGSVMTSRQAAELDHAFERNGFTAKDVKKLSEGDLLAQILLVVRGAGEVVIKKHIIDCDADPFVPDGWKVEEHQEGGQLKWDPGKILFHLDEAQKDGATEGNELRKKLKNVPVLNANVLDYLLANPQLIPEEWKGKYVFFWGTIYCRSDGSLCVRSLYWYSGGWRWNDDWLGYDWDGDNPAVLLAS